MWDKHKGKLPCSSLHACPFSTLCSGYSPYLCTPPCRVGAHTLFTCIVLTLYYSRRGKWNLAVPSHSSANLWRINKPLPHVEDKLVIDLHLNHFVEPALLHKFINNSKTHSLGIMQFFTITPHNLEWGQTFLTKFDLFKALSTGTRNHVTCLILVIGIEFIQLIQLGKRLA